MQANGWEHATIPFDALVTALSNEAEGIRARAAGSLGFRGEDRAVPPLLALLERPEPSPRVRAAAYDALGRLADARALPVLDACRQEESREEVRATCVSALADVGGSASLSLVLETFGTDPSEHVRNRAVDALGAYSDPQSVQVLGGLLGAGDPGLRRRAIAALGSTGSRAATPLLLARLGHAESTIERSSIVAALTRLRDPSATPALLRELDSTDDLGMRRQVAMALAAVRAPSAYDALVGMLSDPEPAVQFYAIHGLRNLGRADAAGDLVDFYARVSTHVAGRTPNALVADAPAVLTALRLQAEALRALAELDAPRGVSAFVDAARPMAVPRDSQAALRVAEALYERRRLALFGLGYTGAPEASELLAGSDGIGDSDPRLRAVAVRSIAVLGEKESVARLLPMLADSAPEVRWTTATALGRLADRRAAGPLRGVLGDDYGEVRKQAALALGYLGDREAYAALLRMEIGDPVASVREAASYAAQLLEQGS